MRLAKTYCAVFAAAGALLLAGGCSKEEPKPGKSEKPQEVRKTCAAVKAAVRGIFRLETAVGREAKPHMESIDVDGMTAPELKAKLLTFTNAAAAHIWMPSEKSWLVVQHRTTNSVPLAAAMDAVADDPVCAVSLPEIFASYAGTLEEIMPAFSSKLEGEVVPEWFVTKKIPELKWLDVSGVDKDILEPTLHEIRSMQVVRRLVLEGNMCSRQASDKKGEDEATEKWSRAMRRNPNDPMLLERLDILAKNAKGFLEVGKVLQAMKCYETIILIDPKNADAVRNFGLCLGKIGRTDMSKEVLKRAEELSK
jgi:hypothetical protein